MPVISRNVPSYLLSVQGNVDGELFWILLFGCYLRKQHLMLCVSKAMTEISRKESLLLSLTSQEAVLVANRIFKDPLSKLLSNVITFSKTKASSFHTGLMELAVEVSLVLYLRFVSLGNPNSSTSTYVFTLRSERN